MFWGCTGHARLLACGVIIFYKHTAGQTHVAATDSHLHGHEHGHTHEHMDNPGKYTARDKPLSRTDWKKVNTVTWGTTW